MSSCPWTDICPDPILSYLRATLQSSKVDVSSSTPLSARLMYFPGFATYVDCRRSHFSYVLITDVIRRKGVEKGDEYRCEVYIPVCMVLGICMYSYR
jgi:hypothetical protein